MAITIVFAPPRTGKTAFMTNIARNIMFDRERTRAMHSEIAQKNANGFNLSMPLHCVSSNYDIIGRMYGYSKRFSYRFNPFRLGFVNEQVKTIFSVPHMAYFITEGQKYLNSRMSMYFPTWQSRWYEQHGHDFIDVFIDVQRPELIDVNIRDLASFIEIVSMKIKYDEYGRPSKVTWIIRKIESSFLLDKYLSSGKRDKTCYVEEKVVSDGTVLSCYDCRSCKPKFYEGHLDEDFDLQEYEPVEQTLESYINYLEKFDDELPKGFYQKRSIA